MFNLLKGFFLRPRSRAELHHYWKEREDGKNDPSAMDKKTLRSMFIAKLITKLRVGTFDPILELGSGTGRNLRWLYRCGYRRLAGIEISEKAANFNKAQLEIPESEILVYVEPIENVIQKFPNDSFIAVFSCAVLEHIHPDSAWIFEEMARIAAKTIITVEDESTRSQRHFPRNYRTVFENLGFHQTAHYKPCYGFENRKIVGRVFETDETK